MGCNPLIMPPESGLDFAWRASVDVFPILTPATVPRTGIPVLNIPRGRGYLELLSPDCYVEWQCNTWHDLILERETPRTGPASRGGVWIQDGIVTLTATVWGAPRFPVDSQTGIWSNVGTIDPKLQVIWHPGATPNDIEDSWRFRAISANSTGFPILPLGPGRDEKLSIVGHARHWCFQSVNQMDLIVGTDSFLTVDPYRTLTGVSASTGAADPWCTVEITNPGNLSGAFNFTWDRFPMSAT